MDAITDAYLNWSLRTKDEGMGVLLDPHPDEMVINHLPLVVVDIFSEYFIHLSFTFHHNPTRAGAYQSNVPMFSRDRFVASGLVNLGLIPCSPYSPTVAITTRALEVFRVTRMRCPRLGIQPYVRALCDIHGVCTVSY